MIEQIEHKGTKMLRLSRDEKDAFPFLLTKSKCVLIVKHFDEIKEFVDYV